MTSHIIGTYRNNPTVENLIKIIVHDLESEFVIVAWYISDNYWYIAGKYDVHISETIDTTGWFINEEPKITSLPFTHSKIKNDKRLRTNKALILYCGNDLDSFPIEALLDKIASDDLLNRQKTKQ